MNSTKENPSRWDPVANYTQNDGQPDQSFIEQKTALQYCKDAVKKYLDVSNSFVKCTGICGAA